MKKLLMIIPLLLASLSSFGQNELDNFKIDGKTIVWQKVYNFPYEDSSKVSNFFYNNTTFSYENNIGICYYRLGYETSMKPIQMSLLLKEYSRIKFILQIKEDRYRITVQSLEPADTFAAYNSGKEAKDKTYLSNIFSDTPYFKKDGSLKQSFITTAPFLNEAFEKIFNYNSGTAIVIDDDF